MTEADCGGYKKYVYFKVLIRFSFTLEPMLFALELKV